MKHVVKITRKPEQSGKKSIPDGAINGNGDLGIILGNCENGMRIYISKADLWQGIESHDRGGLKPLGYIDIPVSEKLYNAAQAAGAAQGAPDMGDMGGNAGPAPDQNGYYEADYTDVTDDDNQ